MKKTTEILLRRCSTLILNAPKLSGIPKEERDKNLCLIASVDANIRRLGYCLSENAIHALADTPTVKVIEKAKELETTLRHLKGDDLDFEPMYPNFPSEVMQMNEVVLYFNAVMHYMERDLHYLGIDVKTEPEAKEYRLPLPVDKNQKLQTIVTGNENEINMIIRDLLWSNISYSTQDKEDLEALLIENKGWEKDIPERMENKENMATLCSILMKENQNRNLISNILRSATDVMRVYAAISGGDVSLSKKPHFKAIPRKDRRLFLGLIERDKFAFEQMSMRPEEFKQMMRYLHVDEFRKNDKPIFERTSAAINSIRNGQHALSNTHLVNKSILEGDMEAAVRILSLEPGMFARRLDELLRKAPDNDTVLSILSAFDTAAEKIPTPLLLNLKGHFQARTKDTEFSAYMPKGDTARIYVTEGKEALNKDASNFILATLDAHLKERFEEKGNLGKVYIDESLKDYKVPLVMRNLSKESKTITRGSMLPVDTSKNILRSFVWWNQDMDVDLSASILDENYRKLTHISYTNLKDTVGCHSGDITYQRDNGHEGECEFIDIDLDAAKELGAKYIVMQVHNFSGYKFSEDECRFGYMEREEMMEYREHGSQESSLYPHTGEIFEPLTVKNIMTIQANASTVIPLVYDVEKEKMLWVDMALGGNRYIHALEATMDACEFVIKAAQNIETISMYDLLSLHVQARGELVNNPLEADEVFSMDKGTTPFETEKIIARFIADGKDEYCLEAMEKEDVNKITIHDNEHTYTICFGDKREDCKILEDGTKELTAGDLFFKDSDLFSRISKEISSHYKEEKENLDKHKSKSEEEIER